MNNKILEITKQLQDLAAANPGLTIYLNEEELTVMIKNDEPTNPNHFIHEIGWLNPQQQQQLYKDALEKAFDNLAEDLNKKYWK